VSAVEHKSASIRAAEQWLLAETTAMVPPHEYGRNHRNGRRLLHTAGERCTITGQRLLMASARSILSAFAPRPKRSTAAERFAA
jgi:hypothetical protein